MAKEGVWENTTGSGELSHTGILYNHLSLMCQTKVQLSFHTFLCATSFFNLPSLLLQAIHIQASMCFCALSFDAECFQGHSSSGSGCKVVTLVHRTLVVVNLEGCEGDKWLLKLGVPLYEVCCLLAPELPLF